MRRIATAFLCDFRLAFAFPHCGYGILPDFQYATQELPAMTRTQFFFTVLESATAAAQLVEFFIPDGTTVRLRLARNISSADARESKSVDFELLEDVMVNDMVVAERGAVAMGTIIDAEAKRRMGRSGKLEVTIDHVRMVDGCKAALRAVKGGEGGSSTGKMTGAIVATSLIVWPAAPFFVFMKGKDKTLPKGTEMTAYMNGDNKLDPRRFAPAQQSVLETTIISSAPAATAPAAGGALTNGEILALKQAGLSDAVILAKVQSSPGRHSLNTQDLIALKKAGVGDNIIAEMLKAKP
jgi:hypothetical protein